MSLRLRLIVAFFVLSVVPLGAVTYFSYANNVQAVQRAASHEANLLADELNQRMQLVTAQLSERVEHLASMSPPEKTVTLAAAKPQAQKPAASKPASGSATSSAAATSSATQANIAEAEAVANADAMNAKVAEALGAAAMLLNNVELRGMRFGGDQGRQNRPPRPFDANASATGGRSRGGPPPDQRGQFDQRGGGPPDQRGGTPPDQRGGNPRSSRGTTPRTGVTPTAPAPPATSATPPVPAAAGAPPSSRVQPPPPPGVPPPGAPPSLPDPNAVDRLTIDLRPIRQEIMKQILPEGQPQNMTPEERQRLGNELNQRMLGIAQGIRLGAAELQKKAEEAQKAQAAAEAEAKAKALAPAKPAAPAGAKTTPPAAPSGTTVVTSVSTPMNRKTQISGNKLGVTMEQDGNVVQVDAEINLPNLLATVFSTTRTDSGEVPFAVGKDGQLYTKSDADKQKIEKLGAVAHPETAATSTAMQNNWITVTTADPSGSGLRFGIARPVGDSMADLRHAAARNLTFGLGLIGLAVVGIVPLSGRLTRNLSLLTEGVGRIAMGDYRARVAVKSHDEVGKLAGAFNSMAEDVERHQHAAIEQERIRRELELGRKIQHEMLPHKPLRSGLTDVKGVSVPAREVGGDFFNYFEVEGGQVALIMGDVSGKGVGAALLMANIQASLRTRLSLGQDLSAVAEATDRDIEENSPGPVYATLFVGLLDPSARVLRYVNAGHHPQYVLRAGSLERMQSSGLPVGLMAGRGYTERSVQLAAGDLLFFYTDGCVEAESETGDMFGTEQLEALLTTALSTSPDDILQRVEAAVTKFRGAQEPFDDETMMAVKIG